MPSPALTASTSEPTRATRAAHIQFLDQDPDQPEGDADDRDPGEQGGRGAPEIARKAGCESREEEIGRATGTGACRGYPESWACTRRRACRYTIVPGRNPSSAGPYRGSLPVALQVFVTAVSVRSSPRHVSHDSKKVLIIFLSAEQCTAGISCFSAMGGSRRTIGCLTVFFPATYPGPGVSVAALSSGILCIITAKTAVPMRLIAPPT